MINAFIFDFDGLIIDSELVCYQSWVEIYKKYQVELPLEKWVDCIGTSEEFFDPVHYLKQITKMDLDFDEVQRNQFSDYLSRTKQLPIKAGILNYLDWAKENNFKLAICSSSDENWVVSHLDNLNITQYFDVIKTKNDVKKVKPDPELYNAIKSDLSIGDFEAVIFEDSLHGITAGRLSNLFTVAIPNELTKLLDLSEAHFVVSGLDSISPLKLLKTLENKL